MFTAGRKLVPAATHNITAVGDGTLSLNTPLHLYLGGGTDKPRQNIPGEQVVTSGDYSHYSH